MNYCHRCGLPATYYIESKEKWACHKRPQKCPTVREKIGKANKEALTGRTLTVEHREAISSGLTDRIVSKETREKISQSNIEHWQENIRIPWNKGKKGMQIPWNKGLKKQESLEILSRDDEAYSNFQKYRNRIAVRTKKTYMEFKEDINPENLMLGKCGIPGAYQIDHIISVRVGFEQNISIEYMSSRENLQILPWLENIKKYDGKRLRK